MFFCNKIGLNVGSRPAKRNPKGGVESLRAIPWVFAWTQTRLNLPTWLGVGEALADVSTNRPGVLQSMNKEWPWFATIVDLLEMILVKSEDRIAANYDEQLVSDAESLELGRELREKFQQTCGAVLDVSGNDRLQSRNGLLLRSLAVRNPYVDALYVTPTQSMLFVDCDIVTCESPFFIRAIRNVVQAELLRRLRSSEELDERERKSLQDALLITINGIANGMRNSG